jgi:hypothetical protein
MPWAKQGLIVAPAGQAPWVGTHAALPVAVPAGGGRHRIYFSSRDDANRSHIGHATLSLDDPSRGQEFAPAPVLSPGPAGAFDDAGVTTSCLVTHGGRQFLYYTGWALGVSVPFYLHAGLAISDDGGQTFQKESAAPLLDRGVHDPFLTASPWVLIDGGRWRMWYVSGTEWETAGSGVRHRYHIKYAESDDGVAWRRDGRVCVDYVSPEEYAFGRPCVVKDASTYRMWYSVRGEAYRLGYAESGDGLSWSRRDTESVVEPSPSGWDAEMVTYPQVVDDGDHRYLLYNGNGYGRTGIGLARWVP